MHRLWQRLRARDPNGAATKRALRAAVVVPVVFALASQVIGNAQLATFAAFGSFAVLMFANFRGSTSARLGAFVALGVAGAVLITLGTLLATPDWLAVTAMAVIAFAVLFAGVVSSVLNAGTQAALLAFILAVMLPGARSVLPDRLAGWGLALLIAVPVAVFVWPAREQDELRRRTAAMCQALAGLLHLEQPSPGEGDSTVAVSRAGRALREAYRASAARAAALSTGARLLIRLVDELEWLSPVVVNACADAPGGWPEQGRRLREAAARVMQACAATLGHSGSRPEPADCADLDAGIAALQKARSAVAEETLAELRGRGTPADGTTPAGEFERPLYAAHELGYAVEVAATTVSSIARADSRSWWARLLGRRSPLDEPGAVETAQRVAVGHLDRNSVWLQNSIRGAAGLAVAVLLSRVVDAQNAFWIGLGALSVLRSNALSTGSTAVRAMLGTVGGFAIGGALVALIGTDRAVLWVLLPVVILVSAAAPAVLSFAAGQAGFTVFVIILFNIIAPAGWQIGVVRVEDVALGCAASLIAGLLFWPRGATAALGTAYAMAYRTGAEYLRAAVDAVTGYGPPAPSAARAATAAGDRLDEALREYLAERGTKHVPLQSVAVLANAATRLRLAATAVVRLQDSVPGGQVVPPDDDRLTGPAEVLTRHAHEVVDWYTALADGLAHGDGALPTRDGFGTGESFLEVVLPAVHNCGDDDRAARAEQLLWSGQYLGDVDQLRAELVEPAEQVGAAQQASWWRD